MVDYKIICFFGYPFGFFDGKKMTLQEWAALKIWTITINGGIAEKKLNYSSTCNNLMCFSGNTPTLGVTY